MTIVVTGATGQLGGRVARLLADAGLAQRLVVRDPTRAPQLPGAEIAVAEFRDGDAVRTALAGADVVLMVSASESADRVAEHFSFVDAAAAAGVGQLVYSSFFAASPDSTFTLGRDHYATEQRIRASGVPFTFLRDNFYADFMLNLAGPDGVIRGPAGDGRVSIVARDDTSDAAAAILQHPDVHRGRTYDLTGPESLSLADVAGILSRHTGRAITFHNETLAEAYESRASYGAPDWEVEAWVSTYTSIASGEVGAISSDGPTITGHPAMSLRELLART